jgi:DNA polymerase epsilon subunit 1
MFVQLEFANVADLLAVRKDLMPLATKNKKDVDVMDAYAEVVRYIAPAPLSLLRNFCSQL